MQVRQVLVRSYSEVVLVCLSVTDLRFGLQIVLHTFLGHAIHGAIDIAM